MIFWLCVLYAAAGLLLGCYWSLTDSITAALCEALVEVSV